MNINKYEKKQKSKINNFENEVQEIQSIEEDQRINTQNSKLKKTDQQNNNIKKESDFPLSNLSSIISNKYQNNLDNSSETLNEKNRIKKTDYLTQIEEKVRKQAKRLLELQEYKQLCDNKRNTIDTNNKQLQNRNRKIKRKFNRK